MAISVEEWLSIIECEYLHRFVPGGGAAVKFLVGDDPALGDIRRQLEQRARDGTFQWVSVDAATTRLHMIQDVFFAIARQIDWEALAQRWVESTFIVNHYNWPRPGEAVPIQELSAANDVDQLLLKKEVRKWLTSGVMRNREMAQDFRAAMAQLCMLRMEIEDARALAPVIQWLRGELKSIGSVREVPINARITRHNGRAMLRSLCHWLRLSGGPGLMVVLDLRQVAFTGPASEGSRRYTPAAVLDVFEVLRQLIDEAESLEGMFLAVLTGPDFACGDPKRSVSAYKALKERIWADVHPRGHENPLAPMLSVATGGMNKPVHAGDMTYSEERVAIEALRAGVPNRAAVRLLGTAEEALLLRFSRKLKECRESHAPDKAVEGEIIAGGFGSGKSHLLGYLSEEALREKFIVSLVAISKETPLFSVERLYAAAIRNAIVPGVNDDVMTAVVARLSPGEQAYAELETWASSPSSGLSPVFAALLYLIPKQATTEEDHAAIGRFLSGGQLSLSRVRQWLRAAGAAKLFDLKPVKADELATQRLRFAPRLFRAAGFSGWCVLLDEIELIGRYSTLQRGKSYAELCRWLGLDHAAGVPGIVSVAAITDDFTAAILQGKLDQEKVPRLLHDKGLEAIARLSRVGMDAIETQQHMLAAPNEIRLRDGLGKVAALYQEAYDWESPDIGIGERRAGGTMRQYIKSWITEWDIRRLLDSKTAIDIESLPPDYTENSDLEPAPPSEDSGADEG